MVDYYVDMLLFNLIFTDQTITVITVIKEELILYILAAFQD